MDALPAGLDPRLRRRAEAAAAWVRKQAADGRAVTVVHHIDADGVSSGAIAAEALSRLGAPFLLQPVKSLDAFHVAKVHELGPEALWFCDLGSTAYMQVPDVPKLVCDHHELVRDGGEESFAHVNPLLDGIPGNTISGASCAFLVAAALDAANLDLLPLALVGATGDRQDRPGFGGTNGLLLEHGIASGLLAAEQDLAWFGPETRPLRKYFHLAREPMVPSVTGDGRAAERLLLHLGIPITDSGDGGDGAPGGERTWGSLSDDERRRIRSRLVEILLDCGQADAVPALFRTVVRVRREAAGSPARELQEFSTLLNSTARYDRPEVGLAVCRGDRGPAYEEALDLLQDHRRHLVGALDALAQCGLTEGLAIQHVHLQDRVRDTVVGIVCGMALGSLGLRRDKVLVGLAWTADGRTKASARAPHELHPRGIDLATALRDAAATVGGQGGGHKGAAGATIPRSAEAAFLLALDGAVAAQLGIAATPQSPSPVPAPPLALVGRGQGRLET